MNLKEEAKIIQAYLEIVCSNNPEEIKLRMGDIQMYMARSGEMLAEAKKELNKKITFEIKETILAIAKENFLSSRAQNALVNSIAEEERFMVDWIERINKSCTHQIDALRSLLSYEKEQLRLNSTGY